jgi:hypothetical protein
LTKDFVHADRPAFELREQIAGGGDGRPATASVEGTLGIGFRIDLGKGQLRPDAIEAVLDRGVADAEELLHLLDGAVAADEGGDEDLILGRQLGERRELESPFDGDVLSGQPDAFDLEGGAGGQPGEYLPVLCSQG